MEIEYSLIQFESIDLKTSQGSKLRGFFANQYRDMEIVHNHHGDRFIYSYPKIQYKVIHNHPLVCGIGEGVNIALQITFDTDNLLIDDKEWAAIQKSMKKENRKFGIVDDYIEYEFLTPWIALNQKNAPQYYKSNRIEQESMLKRILIGNILSMSKGLGYTVNEKIFTWINLKEKKIYFKGMEMKGFIGNLKTNFIIPDYLGIGKLVSRGFGTIKVKER